MNIEDSMTLEKTRILKQVVDVVASVGFDDSMTLKKKRKLKHSNTNMSILQNSCFNDSEEEEKTET